MLIPLPRSARFRPLRALGLISLSVCFGSVAALADESTIGAATAAAAAGQPDHATIVAETHAASLEMREQSLRRTIARDTAWPSGVWGDNLWTLAALHLNERVEEANARLLARTNEYIETNRTNGSIAAPTPEQPGEAPWTFFSVTDYARTLHLFHSASPHFPGRLTAETEAAMKEALWLWTSAGSRLADTGPDDLFLLLGTENHDLNKRPGYYLVTALLQDDPAYRDRKLADGHTTAEHAAALTAFFREWPRSRARSGLWIEVGSNTYQKYSFPALFNLHELAPDPVIRHRFGLLLDLAFIEEAQISVRGRRGGGRSRAVGGGNGFESYKNLLHAVPGQPAGSSHSRVMETSAYQLPAEAILLRKATFPTVEPFVIRNRVLGKIQDTDREGHRIDPDSALVNYAYRSPHYLLGSTLQNPALEYTGISRQQRWCGMLFEDPAAPSVGAVYPVIERTRGGRPQHPFWSVQHENVILLQRIAEKKPGPNGGSYSTGPISMRFDAPGLEIVEEGDWIFAGNGKACIGVRFLDGGHRWNEKQTEAFPADYKGPGDTGRILLHAGDIDSYASFESFREKVRANSLMVSSEKVDYSFSGGSNQIEMARYDVNSLEGFTLPLINGSPVDLHPEASYQSPFLNAAYGSDRVSVTVGAKTRTLDFSEEGR